jgi:hypothetical protein
LGLAKVGSSGRDLTGVEEASYTGPTLSRIGSANKSNDLSDMQGVAALQNLSLREVVRRNYIEEASLK